VSHRKPTVLKVLAGNPGHRPLPRGEPRPDPASGRVPAGLSDSARVFWRKLSPRLLKVGLLTELDELALAQLCVVLAELEEMTAVVKRDGYLIEGYRGSKVKHPLLPSIAANRKAAATLFAKFGLSPVDRGHLDMAAPESEDEFTVFMRSKEKAEDATGNE